MSWCRNGTCGQPSESGRGCCALFETAEPTPVDNHRTNHHSKELVSKWSSWKKRHKWNARVRAGFRKISKSQSPEERRWTVRMQRAYLGRLPHLPDDALFSKKLVMHAHLQTLHGGVSLTMAKIREKYWIPRLRRQTKRVINECRGCKRFHVTALANPSTGNLPKERTEGSEPFKSIGVDFDGPIKYFSKKKREMKAHILPFACSLIPAVYLDLQPDQTTEQFSRSLKRFVARRGRLEKIFSDNGRTLVSACKWLKNVQQDEKMNDWLAKQNIQWQFNLSRAPWWGGQFERLIGVMKRSMYKAIGNGHLRWHKLEEVILDVETTLNNRPLGYLEDDIQMPILTPTLCCLDSQIKFLKNQQMLIMTSENASSTYGNVRASYGIDGQPST